MFKKTYWYACFYIMSLALVKKTELCTEVLEPLKTKLTIVLIEIISESYHAVLLFQRINC